MVRFGLFYALFISELSAYIWKASGNGVTPHLNVPVRTVFIQVYEDDGETPVDVRDLEERKSTVTSEPSRFPRTQSGPRLSDQSTVLFIRFLDIFSGRCPSRFQI